LQGWRTLCMLGCHGQSLASTSLPCQLHWVYCTG
jgi:hypothetical protein